MKTATVLQGLGIVAIWVPVVAVFGFWALSLVFGTLVLLIGIGLERKAVDGP